MPTPYYIYHTILYRGISYHSLVVPLFQIYSAVYLLCRQQYMSTTLPRSIDITQNIYPTEYLFDSISALFYAIFMLQCIE